MDTETPQITDRVANDDAPSSLLEQLAAKRKEISETKETFIPIQGYDREPPLLLARYRLLEGPELAQIGDTIRREIKSRWDRQLYAGIDTMDLACVGIFVDKGDGKPEPLTLNGNPITGFNDDLSDALQFSSTLPEHYLHRDVILGLFANNDLMLSQHIYLLNRWFGDTTINVSEELLAGNF